MKQDLFKSEGYVVVMRIRVIFCFVSPPVII